MNCFIHQEKNAIGICKACHKAICTDCLIDTSRGIACSTECEKEVIDLNILVDKSKQIYSIGSSSKFPPTGSIMLFLMGLLFAGMGVYESIIRDKIVYFPILMGVLFMVFSIIGYIRTRKLNLNC